MREARQTPHGARPNREGVAPQGACVPARRAKPSGRSLEPCSNEWPRGMTVTAATPYRIRLTDLISLAGPCIRENARAFQLAACCGCRQGSMPDEQISGHKNEKDHGDHAVHGKESCIELAEIIGRDQRMLVE